MSTVEMIEQLKHLSNHERLALIEAATRLLQDDLAAPTRKDRPDQDQRMGTAASALRELYEPGGELTEWTSLDAEEILDGSAQG